MKCWTLEGEHRVCHRQAVLHYSNSFRSWEIDSKIYLRFKVAEPTIRGLRSFVSSIIDFSRFFSDSRWQNQKLEHFFYHSLRFSLFFFLKNFKDLGGSQEKGFSIELDVKFSLQLSPTLCLPFTPCIDALF